MRYEELSKEKVELIGSIINGPPNFIDKHLAFFPVGNEILFDNPQLSTKIITTGIWTSGALLAPYAYEVVRQDGNKIDIDWYLLIASGAIMLRNREICKNFLEHHPSELSRYYIPSL